MTASRPGALALVLHSHMPYVEGFGTWPFGEEWLWEAVSCVYLPLLDRLDGAPVTIGLTPVLCDQLEAMQGEAGDRYLAHLSEISTVIHAEDSEALEREGEPQAAAELRRAAGDYARAGEAFERRGRDLTGAFGALERVELWTSAATHALLPLLATDAGRRLQLATGAGSHQRRFGDWGGGLWLPECGYAPGLERDLADHGVRAFCVDQTAVPGFDHLRPVATAAGPLAVPIDWGTVELVWHDRAGYPADGAYRDYHGRTRYDLRPWDNAGRPYDRTRALARTREHAAEFVARAAARVAGGGLLCCALDTELLGHWWYEGPDWLAAVLEEAPREELELVTVSEGLARAEPVERDLAASSWGRGKDLSTWDSPRVADLAFAARGAELRTVRAASGHAEPREALGRAARELLALQASDWAFMVTRELAGEYPRERMEGHERELEAALAALGGAEARTERAEPGRAAEPALRSLAPDLKLSALTSP
ncbi:MAG: 1,4-alpha-glucan branching protein domain-containing protein [Thermoleophilaceae bacterium]